MKLINIALFFLTAKLLFSQQELAPESLHNRQFSVTDFVSFVVDDPDHEYSYLNNGSDREIEYQLFFGKNKNGEDVVNKTEEGKLQRSYGYYYQKDDYKHARLFINIIYGEVVVVVDITFETPFTGTATYRELEVKTGLELMTGQVTFNLGKPIDKNSEYNWYLHGHYYHQPASGKYVHKSRWNAGTKWIKEGEMVIQGDSTIPVTQLNWYKYSNAYYWNPASDVFVTIEDYEKGEFNNVITLSWEERSALAQKDYGWYFFDTGYYQPATNIWVLPEDVDTSEHGESIKTYFSNEPRSEYYGYASKSEEEKLKTENSRVNYNPKEERGDLGGFFLQSGWLYSPEHGWIFTNPEIYPYFYLAKTQSWYCYKPNTNPTLVFDFLRQNWIEGF